MKGTHAVRTLLIATLVSGVFATVFSAVAAPPEASWQTDFLAGTRAGSEKQWDASFDHYQAAAAHPEIPATDAATALLNAANIREIQKRWREAETGYRDVLARYPAAPEAFEAQFAIALIAERRGDLLDAALGYQALATSAHIAGDPRRRERASEYQVGAGLLFTALERHPDAIAAYSRHLKMTPKGPAAEQIKAERDRLARLVRGKPPRPASTPAAVKLREGAKLRVAARRVPLTQPRRRRGAEKLVRRNVGRRVKATERCTERFRDVVIAARDALKTAFAGAHGLVACQWEQVRDLQEYATRLAEGDAPGLAEIVTVHASQLRVTAREGVAALISKVHANGYAFGLSAELAQLASEALPDRFPIVQFSVRADHILWPRSAFVDATGRRLDRFNLRRR
ncbi:MAG: tetratricopeptide (TPR) repeat protein [Myxococcota bacterium]|jgi:tetratricopeptide (TPR) repeat protein